MERREVKSNRALYVCPVCGHTETIRTKKKTEINGIKIEITKRGEGVVEEHRRKIQITEEEIESVLEILESSETSG